MSQVPVAKSHVQSPKPILPNSAAIPHSPLSTPHFALPTPHSLRPDLAAIAELIPAGVKVLDLGCGDGELIHYLVNAKQVKGRGIELSEQGVLACVRRGLSVRQGNLNEGLADYPEHSFDYVVLSQTLPFLSDAKKILLEMLRVGQRAVVSVPNWGYWRCRLELLMRGQMPQAPDLPQPWYEAPRWQAFTVTDFAHFCQQINVAICQEVYLAHGRRIQVRKIKNLLATTAVFTLEKK
jgi:methionine biosynthesis protein MetW